MKKHEWETLSSTDTDDGSGHIARMAVPGGWVYYVFERVYGDETREESGGITSSICFVPDPSE